jgi:hypothetical protein
MPAIGLVFISAATAATLMALGGGVYEFVVIDPAWPARPEIIQPARGGVSRGRFWLPVHATFELMVIVSLVLAWTQAPVRAPLLIAFACHAGNRIWSFLDFIPKAIAFERADPASISVESARRWTRRSRGRLPLAVAAGVSMIVALIAAARVTA